MAGVGARGFPALVLALSLGQIGGCGGNDPGRIEPVVDFDTAAVRIETASDTFRLRVEVAETGDQRAYGLMEREDLAEDRGMLFVYDREQRADAGFWMFRTLIPLDIAYLDDEGRIVAIRAMEPCGSPNPGVCPLYPPGAPYHAALEVNRGYLERRGIDIGDRVVREPDGAGPTT